MFYQGCLSLVLRSDIHCIKYTKIRTFFDTYFPVDDSVLIRKNMDTITRYTQIRKNTDQREPAFQHVLPSD